MALDLERLKAFRAVATEKSFSRGAKRIFRTQPAISQAIGQLERQVEQKLFKRMGRSIKLTEAGKALFAKTEEVFSILEEAEATLAGLTELRHGTLRLGASDTTTCYVLPPILSRFRQRYPGVEVLISNRPSPGVLDQVLAREVDLGMVTLPLRHTRIVVREMFVREDVVICSPSHPLARRKRLQLKDLARHPLLLLDRGSNTRTFIDTQFRAAHVSPQVAMELASIEAIKILVKLDLGISIVPRVAVEREVRQHELCAVSVFSKSHRRKVGFIRVKSGQLSPAAQEFLALATSDLGQRLRPDSIPS